MGFMTSRSSIRLLSTLALSSTLLNCASAAAANVQHINYKPEKVLSNVEFTYSGTSLDGPKVRPVNTTSYDWWYFDAVSSDLAAGDLSSAVIVFYDATPGGFAALSNKTTKLEASITGTFKNGTIFEVAQFPSEAVVVTGGDGSAGRWGKSASWRGTSNLKEWNIQFADSAYGVKGHMLLESVAPPHLPCGSPTTGATEVLMPSVGWAAAVPDAKATVEFEIAGETLSFTGVGYHDKNWGSGPFFDEVGFWYWGHGHLGPYSVVWFDAVSLSGAEYFSSYVAENGKVLSASCKKNIVKARPQGGEDAYPPPQNNKVPNGFEITFADVEGKEMVVNVKNSVVVIPDGKVYDRFIGTIEGGFSGEKQKYKGVAQYEQFKV